MEIASISTSFKTIFLIFFEELTHNNTGKKVKKQGIICQWIPGKFNHLYHEEREFGIVKTYKKKH